MCATALICYFISAHHRQFDKTVKSAVWDGDEINSKKHQYNVVECVYCSALSVQRQCLNRKTNNAEVNMKSKANTHFLYTLSECRYIAMVDCNWMVWCLYVFSLIPSPWYRLFSVQFILSNQSATLIIYHNNY